MYNNNYYTTPSYNTMYDTTNDYETMQAMQAMETILDSGVGVWIGIAGILSLVGGILTYFLFVKRKDQPKGKFAKWLKDFLNFKVFWLEPILKVVYYIATIFVILFSFSFFAFGGAGILLFFVCLIGGPVLVRLCYEMTMMFIMIWRNTKDIAENAAKPATKKAEKK